MPLRNSAACTFSTSQGTRARKPTTVNSSWRTSRLSGSKFAGSTGPRARTRRESRGESRVSRTAARTPPKRAHGSAFDTERRCRAPRRSWAFGSSSSIPVGWVNSSRLKRPSTSRSCSAVNDPPPRSISLRRACDQPSFLASSVWVHRRSVLSVRTRAATRWRAFSRSEAGIDLDISTFRCVHRRTDIGTSPLMPGCSADGGCVTSVSYRESYGFRDRSPPPARPPWGHGDNGRSGSRWPGFASPLHVFVGPRRRKVGSGVQ